MFIKILCSCFLLFCNVNQDFLNEESKEFLDVYLQLLNKHEIDIVEYRKESLKDSFLYSYITCQVDNIKNKQISTTAFNQFKKSLPKNDFEKILYHLNNGDFILSNHKDKVGDAIIEYIHAYNLSKKYNNKPLICESLKRICSFYFKTQKSITDLNVYSKIYSNYTYNQIEEYSYNFYLLGLKMQQEAKGFKNLEDFNPKIDSKQFYNLITLAKKTNVHYLIGEAYQQLGNYYMFNRNLDSTYYYYNLAKINYDKYSTKFSQIKSIGLEINQTIILQQKGEYQKSLNKLDSLLQFKIPNQNLQEQISIFQNLKNASKQLGNYKKAFEFQKNEKELKDSLDLINQKVKISDIQTKYQTVEKEKQILIEQQKKKQNRNIAFGLAGLLLFGSLIFFLIQKNTKRKQLLAEQEKELETQKVTTLLKEQELTAIDAMIEGQEKERQRIANDLHDDLGGLMATVKLHFNALKEKQSPELYKKTTELLDEAYNKVRSVAHAKNSGVMAKKGLLKALNDMAKTVSASNQLQVDIFDHGLDERLENSLELTIFRIVQELITNVIKHANANEASIHITKHENSLNIMVEDNGKGFNTKNIAKKSGMGIHSIDKRIENLGGKVTIESEINKGTTIIIDIPS